MPVVTVIVPSYNHECFLIRRLNSVFNQTYHDYQVIIIDDRSTDNSLNIIDQYKDHPRLKAIVVNEQNSGRPMLQWLKGVALADTEWIWIAESDDYCDEQFLQSLVPAFQNADAVLALSDIVFVDEQNTIIKSFPNTTQGFYPGISFINDRMIRDCFVCNSGMAVFRKNAAPMSGEWLDQYSFSPDYYFWTTIMQKGNVYACGQSLAYFRKHAAEFTHGKLESVSSQSDHANLLGLLNKKGLLEKEKLANVITDKLVSLYTRQKGMQRSLFDSLVAVWSQLAIASGIPVNNTMVSTKAMLRKIKHRLRKFYAIS